MDPLVWAGRHAKWVLASGLVVAVILPGVAELLSGHLTLLICAIMFIGAARLRPDQFSTLWVRPREILVQVLLMQLVLPGAFALIFWVTETHITTFAQITVLLLAAPAIVSSPNMAAMLKLDVAASMRLLVWSTVLLPITSLPLLTFVFGTNSAYEVIEAELRLIAIIAIAGGLGIGFRHTVLARMGDQGEIRLDGISALALAVFVVALMPAITSGFSTAPWQLVGWLAFAFVINFGLQIKAFWVLKRTKAWNISGAYALAYGNRNLALFFAALMPEQTAQFLIFLAAYQIPMYLTPLLLTKIYRVRP